MNWISKLFPRSPQAKHASRRLSEPAVPRRPTDSTIPLYPPVDEGVGASSVDEILSAPSIVELIERIRIASAMKTDDFDTLIVPVIRNYAAFVHLLPASENAHYKGAGGLLSFGLNLGFYSLQACNGVIFSSAESVERRRMNEHRWCYATFLSALCNELHVPLTQMTVVLESGEEWPSYQTTLSAWLTSKGVGRYWIRWLERPLTDDYARRGTGAYVLHQILPPKSMDYLKEAGSHVVTAMMSVVTGDVKPGEQLPIWEVVSTVRRKLIERDIGISPALYGKLTIGTHIEPNLLDAMRTLHKTGKWQVNERKSRLWYRTDGLFLVWSTGTHKELDEQLGDIKGLPRSEATILEVLMNGGIIVPAGDGSPFWAIENERTTLRCIRFANPALIFPDEASAPTPIVLAKPSAKKSVERAPPEDKQSTLDLGVSVNPADGQQPTSATEPIEETMPHRPVQQPRDTQTKSPDLPPAELGSISIQSLDRDAAVVMEALLEDVKAKKVNSALMGSCELGFAITIEHLQSYGVDTTSVLSQLHKQGWIVPDPDKAGRKIQTIELKGKPQLAFVINAQIAKAVGFVS